MNLKGIEGEWGTAHRVKILPRLNARHTFCDMGWDVYRGRGGGWLGRKEKRNILFLLSFFYFLYSFPVGVSLQVEEIKSNNGTVGSCLSPHHKTVQLEKYDLVREKALPCPRARSFRAGRPTPPTSPDLSAWEPGFSFPWKGNFLEVKVRWVFLPSLDVLEVSHHKHTCQVKHWVFWFCFIFPLFENKKT